MSNLIVIPKLYSTIFRMRGLSTKLARDLCKDESGYFIDNESMINPKTAFIAVPDLVKFIKELKDKIEITKITIRGYYEVDGAELMKLVNQD